MAEIYIPRSCDSDGLWQKHSKQSMTIAAFDQQKERRTKQTKAKCLRSKWRKKCHENPLQWFRSECYLFMHGSDRFIDIRPLECHRRQSPTKQSINISTESTASVNINQNHLMHSCIPCAVGTLALAPGRWLSENVCLKVHAAHPDQNRHFFLCFHLERNSEMHLRTQDSRETFSIYADADAPAMQTKKPNGEQQPANRGKNLS